MPTFSLGDCSLTLTIEPLQGPHAQAERNTAWQIYLQLIGRSALRSQAPSNPAIQELIDALRQALATWPAAQVDEAEPTQLGAVVLTLIDMVLVPCLRTEAPSRSAWLAVQGFCLDLAREIAAHYRFYEVGAPLPADLEAAWQVGG